MCCLGVACDVLKKYIDDEDINIDSLIIDYDCLEDELDIVREMLKLRLPEGEIDTNKITNKWKKILGEKYKFDLSKKLFLTSLNDSVQDTYKTRKMSHKMIGKFIRENPEAVFVV